MPGAVSQRRPTRGRAVPGYSTLVAMRLSLRLCFRYMGIRTQHPRASRLAGTSRRTVLAGAVAALAVAAAGCGSSSPGGSADSTTVISAVGAENEYANVLGQIGGRYVHMSSILDNPNTDPPPLKARPAVAQQVSTPP